MFGFEGREADGVIIGQTVGKWWALWCTTTPGGRLGHNNAQKCVSKGEGYGSLFGFKGVK